MSKEPAEPAPVVTEAELDEDIAMLAERYPWLLEESTNDDAGKEQQTPIEKGTADE